jgi:RNA polymerase sigma-70 factor (ECF subfamily)
MLAAQEGNRDAIVRLLDANARLVSDGGGKVNATIRPLQGAERIARMFWAIARRSKGALDWHLGHVNGEPALLRTHEGRLHSVTTITVEGDRITGIFTVLNPDKLEGLI